MAEVPGVVPLALEVTRLAAAGASRQTSGEPVCADRLPGPAAAVLASSRPGR